MLDVVREQGHVSRVELASLTGLTQATISTVVRGLLDDGLLVESGQREFTGGKPRIKLMLNPRARCAVGVQLGADWVVACVVDTMGAIVARTRVRGVRDRDPASVVTAVADTVAHLLDLTGLPPEAVVGLGLALPGVLDLEAGTILDSRSLPRWSHYPVRTELARAAGLDVVVETIPSAAAIGEFWGGGIPSSRAHCTVYMGASIGVGIVLAGTVYRGASGNVGAIGGARLRSGATWEPGPTLEDLACPRAVAANARSALARGRSTTLTLPAGEDPLTEFDAVAAAAIAGDPLAVALVEESADHLANAVLDVASLLDVDSIALAGPAFTVAGSIYLRVLDDRLARDFPARAGHDVIVRLSAQVADAAAVGSASLVLQRQLAPRHADPVQTLT